MTLRLDFSELISYAALIEERIYTNGGGGASGIKCLPRRARLIAVRYQKGVGTGNEIVFYIAALEHLQRGGQRRR